MSRSEALDRWKPALVNTGSAVAVGVLGYLVEGRLTPFVALAVAIALGWGWWVSPLRRAAPHVPHHDALRRSSRRDLIVYWRPGCSWCIRLWRDLDPDVRDRVTWVNVMADVEGSRYIRQFHDGDMVTPTAVTGGGRQVAATAESITSRVGQARTS
jgi:mycoredoxin